VKCLDVATGRVYISRDVVFDEAVFPIKTLHPNAGALLRKEILLLDQLIQTSICLHLRMNNLMTHMMILCMLLILCKVLLFLLLRVLQLNTKTLLKIRMKLMPLAAQIRHMKCQQKKIQALDTRQILRQDPPRDRPQDPPRIARQSGAFWPVWRVCAP
jgi:hypothetical protein